MNLFRTLIGLPVAALITAALFMFMAGAIKQEPALQAAKPQQKFEILAKKRPERTEIVVPEPVPEPPEPVEIKDDYRKSAPEGLDGGVIPGPIEGELTPVPPGRNFGGPTIKIAPDYPERCRARGAQGAVLVQFDVTPEGQVVNAVVIESDDRCFDRTVLRTIQRYKYPPAYDSNGKPIARRGVVEQFVFELSE